MKLTLQIAFLHFSGYRSDKCITTYDYRVVKTRWDTLDSKNMQDSPLAWLPLQRGRRAWDETFHSFTNQWTCINHNWELLGDIERFIWRCSDVIQTVFNRCLTLANQYDYTTLPASCAFTQRFEELSTHNNNTLS